MGENEYGKSGHLSFFLLFEALNDAFEVQTLIACRAICMQLRFLKVKTLFKANG